MNNDHGNPSTHVKKNKRGRPEKVIEVNDEELWEKIFEAIRKQVIEICNSDKNNDKTNDRADTLRVRLIRLAKKIPLNMLHELHAKSKYKSNIKAHYRKAFLDTYKRFKILLNIHGIEQNEDFSSFEGDDANPENFLEFCSLHFPKKKVMELFKDIDRENVTKQLENRDNTSLKGFIEMAKSNRCLFHVIRLLKYACEKEVNPLHPKASNIINTFLNKEMEFYPAKKEISIR